MLAEQLIRDIEKKFELHQPLSWDRSGLIQGSLKKEVSKMLIAVEVDEKVVNSCIEKKIDFLLLHHPPIFGNDNKTTNPYYDMLRGKKDLVIYAAHSSLDLSPFGASSFLAEELGLRDTKRIEDGTVIGHCHISLDALVARIKKKLGVKNVKVLRSSSVCNNIGVHGGQSFEDHHIEAAKAHGADTYVGGDLAHHQAEYGKKLGLNLIDATHIATENLGMQRIYEIMKKDKRLSIFFVAQREEWWYVSA